MEEKELTKKIFDFEKKYRLNTFEILSQENVYYSDWKDTAEILIFENYNPFLLNTVNDFKGVYFTQKCPKKNLYNKIASYCQKIDYNKIVIITNKDKFYEGIIKMLNQNSKHIYLISDNPDDLKLKNIYGFLIIKITNDIKKEFNLLRNNKKIFFK